MSGRLIRKVILVALSIGGYFYLNGVDETGDKRVISLIRKYTGQTVSLPN